MARTLQIRWSEGESVTARLIVPADARGTAVLTAHGAGVGQDHHFMEALREGFGERGLISMTFNYRYMDLGRKAPDRMETLLAVHEAAADRLSGYADRFVLAGKSMGGRVASHLVGDRGWPTLGLIYFGYPLVPLGKGEPRSTAHLSRIEAPQLFFAGTRDRLSPPPMIAEIAADLSRGELVAVEDADHSFNMPKRAGVSTAEVMRDLLDVSVDRVAAWEGGGQTPGGGT